MAKRPVYITVTPEIINGHMAAHGGRLLLHLVNYFEVSTEKPAKPTDTNLQQFLIMPDETDLNTIVDGGVQRTYVWRGPKNNRMAPQELVSVEVAPMETVIPAVAAKATPAQVARDAFNEYPEPVRIAAVIAAADSVLVDTLPHAPGQLKAWADATLASYAASTKG